MEEATVGKKKRALILLALSTGLVTSGCIGGQTKLRVVQKQEQREVKDSGLTDNLEEKGIKGSQMNKYDGEVVLELAFDNDDTNKMEKANGWTNGYMFDCTWRADNVVFENESMFLKIDQDGENAQPKWSGGEYRTREWFHYGMYEVRMKPIKNNGVVSSFFTYTGPSDNKPWDEIDIEFLGKDTTKVQFNYFTDGEGDHEYIYDLGFDASEEFHHYAFEWLPDSITWYVDGAPVYTATENIPQTPGKVMMNVWPGIGVDSWLNAFDGTVPLAAEYDWMRITQYDLKK